MSGPENPHEGEGLPITVGQGNGHGTPMRIALYWPAHGGVPAYVKVEATEANAMAHWGTRNVRENHVPTYKPFQRWLKHVREAGGVIVYQPDPVVSMDPKTAPVTGSDPHCDTCELPEPVCACADAAEYDRRNPFPPEDEYVAE